MQRILTRALLFAAPVFALSWSATAQAPSGLLCNALSDNYGVGWPGTSGVPALTTTGLPEVGATCTLDIDNASALPQCACLLVGNAPAGVATPLGGTILVDYTATSPLGMVPAAGTTLLLTVPDDLSLCGIEVRMQLVHSDAGASHGVAFSRGLRLRIGIGGVT